MSPDLRRMGLIVARLSSGVYVVVNGERLMGLIVYSHPPLSECGELRFREPSKVAA